MEKRRQAGGSRPAGAGAPGFAGGGRPGGMGAARGPMAPQPPSQASPSTADATAALNAQIRALERRVSDLDDSLKKTREELEEARRERVAPAVAKPAATAPAAHAAAPARPAVAAASSSNTDKRRSAAAKTKLASLKKASPKK